jgi:hypothetical protein
MVWLERANQVVLGMCKKWYEAQLLWAVRLVHTKLRHYNKRSEISVIDIIPHCKKNKQNNQPSKRVYNSKISLWAWSTL